MLSDDAQSTKEADVNEGKWIGVGGHFELEKSGGLSVARGERRDGPDTDFLEIPWIGDLHPGRLWHGVYVSVHGRRISRRDDRL